MRKHIIPDAEVTSASTPGDWLDVDSLAEIEMTSEDPEHPIESALEPGNGGAGWRAGNPGEQVIRICFTEPRSVERIRLVFQEEEIDRTQEFVLRWLASEGGGEYREIVRQQYNFSPPGTVQEGEEYRVNLEGVAAIELTIVPDIGRNDVYASLKEIRVA